jgi:cytochrome c
MKKKSPYFRLFPTFLASMLPLAGLITACQHSAEPSGSTGVSGVVLSAQSDTGDALVFRSVIDKRPRMLTMQLADDFWVAYDTAAGSIYKVWKQGVSLQGAVYDTRHGPQPFVKGNAWLVSPDSKPWSVVGSSTSGKPKVRYRGHAFIDGQNPRPAELNWELRIKNDKKIEITETPRFVVDESGRPGLERVFKVSGVPKSRRLELQLHLDSLPDAQSYTTDGGFTVQSTKSISHDGQQGVSVEGVLRLNSNGRTRFTTWFQPQPMVAPIVEKNGFNPAKPAGLVLIENSDCQACHNAEVKTVGPSYRAISEKYPHTDGVIARLSSKVINGGNGAWGNAMMTPHTGLSRDDADLMLTYILSLDGEPRTKDKLKEQGETIALTAVVSGQSGLAANLYDNEGEVQGMHESFDKLTPVFSGVLPAVHAMRSEDVAGFSKNFHLELNGYLNIKKAGDYLLRLVSDDGSVLSLDGKKVIDNDGFHGAIAKDQQLTLTKGEHPLLLKYYQGGGDLALSLQWMKPGDHQFSVIPAEYFSYEPKMIKAAKKVAKSLAKIPGSGSPVNGVHPSFDLQTIRPESFKPMVGGLDVLSDGRVVVSTWDSEGAVYVLSNIDSDDPEQIQVKRIAHGLAEPLGLKVVNDEIYVLQKHELTKLVDRNGDDVTDIYQTISNDWGVSANFHEFAFGLEYKQGYFYAALATAINPGGASTQPQIQDRGKVAKISKRTGNVEFIAQGLRTPNGIGVGFDGEMFIADNQGDWLPSSKIVHVKPGAFYGSHSVNREVTKDLPVTQPVVWLPQDEIGNSPSQPGPLNVGPYQHQMIHGEVTHGGLKRVFVEKVNGSYQGAVFRFTQGLEAGVNRIAWDGDNTLYIGGIGNPGNWGHSGKRWYGLQRMSYNGQSTFEMLKVSARSDGMAIEFTEPLKENDGFEPEDYRVTQWRYEPTEQYGGPKLDETQLKVEAVSISADRKRVFLELDGMKAGHVVHIQLQKHFVSAKNHQLWTTESWYTLNHIPKNRPGFPNQAWKESKKHNRLSAAEKAAGWKLLMTNKSADQWRGFRRSSLPKAWQVVDGVLTFSPDEGDRGDIITDGEYENFELQLEWKISEKGNSGIFYNVVEADKYKHVWQTGPEMQVLDNERHPDSKDKHRAGDLYDLTMSNLPVCKPAGSWNRARIVINKGNVQHWLNGLKVAEFTLWTHEWNNMVAGSKFKSMPDFGIAKRGHIALQDHGDKVWYRNIKIREL